MNKILVLVTMAIFISNQAWAMNLKVTYLPESDAVQVSFDGPPVKGRLKLSILTCNPGGDTLGTIDYSGLVDTGLESLETYVQKFRASEFPCRPSTLTIEGFQVSIPATTTVKEQPWGSNAMECIRPQLVDFRDYVEVNQKDFLSQNAWPGIDNLDTLTIKIIRTKWGWVYWPVTSKLLERINDCLEHFPNEK